MAQKYVLPELDYEYSALEPFISGEIMELHHAKHHAGYVSGANAALEALDEARKAGTAEDKVATISKNLAFNLGGHINHSLFWKNLAPQQDARPEGELAAAIDEEFGSFEQFQKEFGASATSIQGSGWAVLAWDMLSQRLVILQVTNGHQDNHALTLIPLLLLDMWEHAFYLQYKNVKADYVKAFWNVINWEEVQKRFAGTAKHWAA
ncbi:superoxide dismutase [Lawsonella clevelandensis]|uniref:superoxide dismutase n=1 Tax=Lawsonella clevelandensis TaxID=1528099 RepID=UPI0006B486E3|nr:superoxide dismutase [Lawsonella clevelandensis]ALE34647.1 superoxide dismutase [Lawsonella clevelandensis]